MNPELESDIVVNGLSSELLQYWFPLIHFDSLKDITFFSKNRNLFCAVFVEKRKIHFFSSKDVDVLVCPWEREMLLAKI